MRYGIAIPQANRFADREAMRTIVRAAEELGFDSIWVSDHIIVPEGSTYIPEMMYEPLALLAWLAGETRHVVVGSSVLIAPYRNPVFTAKFLSTVDHLSGGRLVVGIGAGWLREEFEALGVPFEERGPRTDEAIRVLRDLWETETSTFAGRWHRYTRMRMYPKASPMRRGTIPVLVGGNGAPSIRRAAALGEGWHPINLGLEAFRIGVERYRAACEGYGKSPGPVVLRHMPGGRTRPTGERWPFTGDSESVIADIRAYAEAGMDELVLSTTARTVGEYVAELRRFAREVMYRA